MERRLVGSLLVVAAVAAVAGAEAAAGGGRATLYYHFQNITSGGDFEAGHLRGNPAHWVSRNEHQQGAVNKGHVQWQGGGSSGLQVWDLEHSAEADEAGRDEAGEEAQQVAMTPHLHSGRKRSSGSSSSSSSSGGSTRHPDCLLQQLQQLQRRAHSTLITRDCAGNPLEPPGVRLSPGTPRPRLQPRAPTPPPPPPSWRPSPALTEPPPPPATDVYLLINKRGGRAADAGGGATDPPRGFEPTAAEDQEGQEDHLRGMKHADKQLMFGDGSYQSAFKLKPLKLKGHVLHGPMKGPITLKVAPLKAVPLPLGGLRPRPAVTRVKPMVVLVRPMSSNRTPMGGPGPAAAAKPLRLGEWLASMWAGG